ncbi:MAG TPA: C40 family peptidase [Flavobacteriaceae bacterium]|nr:C40 family peptidase [Flavobacteriaceae bacterium]
MQYGICNLSIVPIRFEPSDKSELVSQLLYGDHFKIIEKRKFWYKIRVAFDGYEGWIDKKQCFEISKEQYNSTEKSDIGYSYDLIEYVQSKNQELILITIGASLNGLQVFEHNFDGNSINGIQHKKNLINTAFLYMNAPYLWGGKTPLGIDCSGFTQMVYKINGYKLLRDASQQATQGEALSFIEESEPGDLAFFDNDEGNIVHVGIILKDNYIIHAHGKVRIDRLDHTGIYNVNKKKHTHKLRVIKKIV